MTPADWIGRLQEIREARQAELDAHMEDLARQETAIPGVPVDSTKPYVVRPDEE